jgi:hypothetical protein
MRFRPTEQALVKPLDEGAIALNLQTGEYYTLNEVAARMWALLVEGHDQGEVVQAIVAEYDVSAEEVASDLEQLLHQLKEQKLVTER